MEEKPTGKLGFGLMRLPRKGAVINVAETSKMVDIFINSGFTYFDTALYQQQTLTIGLSDGYISRFQLYCNHCGGLGHHFSCT